jgi:FkbM family methyltransferase
MKDLFQKLIRTLGYDVRRYQPSRDPFCRLQLALRRHQIGVVLDVGANIGQFAKMLRKAGYRGRIISFEPLSDAHATLVRTAQKDALWTVASRCALAAKHGETEINIAANSQSSSILDMLERHVAGAPESKYMGKETVTMITLDSFFDNEPDMTGTAIALKIDAQGYEAEVLAGLNRWSDNVEVILAELSLTPLYQGETRFIELYRVMEDRGYRCTSIEAGFTDPNTYEVLQVDAIFER